MMSAPFPGPPALRVSGSKAQPNASTAPRDILADLAALPQPRKHYHRYYSEREADANMRHAAQGIHAFLRGYYHHKSADRKANQPFRLQAGAPKSWQRCRPTTSWTWRKGWPKRSPPKCQARPKSPRAAG